MDAVTAVTAGDSFSYAAAAPAVGDSGLSASRDDDFDVGGSKDHHGGLMLHYWIHSTVSKDQLEELQSDGVLPAGMFVSRGLRITNMSLHLRWPNG